MTKEQAGHHTRTEITRTSHPKHTKHSWSSLQPKTPQTRSWSYSPGYLSVTQDAPSATTQTTHTAAA